MTEKSLITLPKADVPAIPTDDDAFADATKTGEYLPRLQLMTSNSDMCKSGEFPINHYALVDGQKFADLGAEVNVLLIAWRPKALQMGEEIISVFDNKDPEFARIRELSAEKDSMAMYGPEFLVWVPDAQKFATFFMGSKSLRREASSARDLLENAATLKAQKISNAKYTWFSAKVERCTTLFDLPNQESLDEEYNKFLNPPKKTVERVAEEDKSTRTR